MIPSPMRNTPSPVSGEHGNLHAEIFKNDLLLHEAVIKNDVEEVKRILKEPCDVNSRNNYGRAPIHWAASRGSTDLMKLLINAKCDIEARDKYGMRPLLMTAWHGHEDAMKLLLDSGACVNSVNKLQQSLLMCAARNRRSKCDIVEHVLKLLSNKETAVRSKTKGTKELDVISREKNVAILPELDIKDAEGHSALHHAAIVGHEYVVQRLAMAGANVNSSDNLCRTPLHSACSGGHLTTVTCLLECGANCEAMDCSGDTPLHAAICAQHRELVEALLKYGSKPDVPNDKGWTPLHIASSMGCRGIIETLIQNGASMNKQDNCGNTPVHIACQSANIDTVEIFIAKGAELNTFNLKAETPMQIAATRGDATICRAMLAAGATSGLSSGDQNAPAHPPPKGSPFMAAARGSLTAIVDMIIKTAKLDCPSDSEDVSDDPGTSKGNGSTVKPIIEIPKINWKTSEEDLSQLSEEERMKEIIWRLAYRQLLNGEWKKLAYHWNFTEDQIKDIELQYSGSTNVYREHGYRMLLQWQSGLSPRANQLKELCESLEAIGKRGIAGALKKIQEKSEKETKANNICNCVNCSIT